MIENHNSLLTVGGYTIRGILDCHIADGLGTMDATRVEYRDIAAWVKNMQAKVWHPRRSRTSTA